MQKQHGFTLLELSIVIVIIGLIVAGISAGQSLVKVANIRSEITMLEQFNVAYNSFDLAYDAVPGDMDNADSYWATTTAGDGDGYIEKTGGGNIELGTYAGEVTHFYEQLSLAGLIQTDYDSSNTIGVGFPASNIHSNIGILAGQAYGNVGWNIGCDLRGSKQNVLVMAYSTSDQLPDLNASDGGDNYTPIESLAIDSKIDDNSAKTGTFISVNSSGATNGTCHDVSETVRSCRSCFYLR